MTLQKWLPCCARMEKRHDTHIYVRTHTHTHVLDITQRYQEIGLSQGAKTNFVSLKIKGFFLGGGLTYSKQTESVVIISSILTKHLKPNTNRVEHVLTVQTVSWLSNIKVNQYWSCTLKRGVFLTLMELFRGNRDLSWFVSEVFKSPVSLHLQESTNISKSNQFWQINFNQPWIRYL